MRTRSFIYQRGGSLIALLASAVALMGGTNLRLPAQNVPEIVWETNAHYGIHAVAFSGDGQTLVSGAQDQTVKVWSKTNPVLLRTFQITGGAVLSVALSPDGSLVTAVDGDGKTRVWRVADGVRLWQNSPSGIPNNSVAFSHDGTRIVVAAGFFQDGKLGVGDATNGYGFLLDGYDDDIPAVYGAVFSPDDTLVASSGADGTAKLWRLSDKSLVRTFVGHSNTVFSVDFSPDGTLLATASSDGTARLWRVSDGTVVRVIEGGGGTVAKFSPDGRLLFTLNGGPITVWRVSNGQWLHTYTNTAASTLAVSPDDKHFAYGVYEGTVFLARLPVWIVEATCGDFTFSMRWQGGNGSYQVQARTSLTSGTWQILGGPTTNTSFSNICLSPMFYRVQSLTGP